MKVKLSDVIPQEGMLIRNSQGQLLVLENGVFGKLVSDTTSRQIVLVNPTKCTVVSATNKRKK